MPEKPCGINCAINCCDPVVIHLPYENLINTTCRILEGSEFATELAKKKKGLPPEEATKEMINILAESLEEKIHQIITKEKNSAKLAEGEEGPFLLRGIANISPNTRREIAQEFGIRDIVLETQERITLLLDCDWFEKVEDQEGGTCSRYHERPKMCQLAHCIPAFKGLDTKLRSAIFEQMQEPQEALREFLENAIPKSYFKQAINSM